MGVMGWGLEVWGYGVSGGLWGLGERVFLVLWVGVLGVFRAVPGYGGVWHATLRHDKPRSAPPRHAMGRHATLRQRNPPRLVSRDPQGGRAGDPPGYL